MMAADPAPRPALTSSPVKPTLDDVKRLVGIVMPIPWWWVVVIVVGMLLSVFQVSHGASGWTVAFQVSASTVALFGALWLPTILRMVAVAGGSIPTPAGTASTQGITAVLDKLDLDPETKRAALAPVAAAIETSSQALDPEVQ